MDINSTSECNMEINFKTILYLISSSVIYTKNALASIKCPQTPSLVLVVP